MSPNGDSTHNEESNVSQDDHYDWSNEGPDEVRVGIQEATVKKFQITAEPRAIILAQALALSHKQVTSLPVYRQVQRLASN